MQSCLIPIVSDTANASATHDGGSAYLIKTPRVAALSVSAQGWKRASTMILPTTSQERPPACHRFGAGTLVDALYSLHKTD